MKFTMIAVLGGALGFAQAAQAVEVTGGSVGLSYSAFTDETDLNRLSVEGSVELGFTRNISVQGDLGYDKFGFSDSDSKTIGLHAIYHIDDKTSLGAFYTMEDFEDQDLDSFGVEAGYEHGQMEFEGYLGRAEIDSEDATLIGLSGRYALDNGLGLGADYDRIDDDGVDVTRITVRLDRDVSANTNLFLEVGSGKISAGGDSVNESFVGVGGKIAFGAERGATFERRGVFKIFPGF